MDIYAHSIVYRRTGPFGVSFEKLHALADSVALFVLIRRCLLLCAAQAVT
jgi:hypothetical protein